MASILPGFEYDIFISYRQKDNEYDGWVTEFVKNLKRELDATFKEEISIYFDANPQDGLLENYAVDESLAKKMKSLIFIPIISQIYCDPKSFAWQNELCAFNKSVRIDRFGRDIKLSSGNVASRILPVKIHDLDQEDKNLLENELGGVLRCIDFIYKSVGVNRPLRSSEDHPHDNLNKTYYRDQINKVANAVKEIITTLGKNNHQADEVSKKVIKKDFKKRINLNTKFFIVPVLVLILLVLGYLFIPKLVNFLNPVEKSIAVLPFYNDSPSDSNKYFINGIMDEVLNNLQTIKDLRVLGRTSVEQFRNNITRSIPEIARKLGVNYIVEGSGQKYGNTFRLRVQLIRAKGKETHIWAKSFEKEIRETKDILSIQIQIAKEIAAELQAVITPKEKQIIEKTPTKNLAAYDCFLNGQFYWRKLTHKDLETARSYFELAKEKDPDFALAYAGISDTWLAMAQNGFISAGEAGPKALSSLMKAIELDSTLSQVHYSLALVMYASGWDWKSSEHEFEKAIAVNPNNAEANAHYANLLNITGRPKEAEEHIEAALKLDPYNPLIKNIYSVHLLFARRYDDAFKASNEALSMDPTNPIGLFANAFALHMSGKYSEALNAWKASCYNSYKGYKDIVHAFDKGYSNAGYPGALKLEAETLVMQLKGTYYNPTDISTLFLAAGENDKALEYMKIAFEVHDPNLIYVLLPLYDNLRNNQGFQDLCGKMNLPCR